MTIHGQVKSVSSTPKMGGGPDAAGLRTLFDVAYDYLAAAGQESSR